MPRQPPKPPHITVKLGDKILYGELTAATLQWLLEGNYEAETNIGSVNSGVELARQEAANANAAAAAAQATADSAKQDAQDIGSETLPFTVSVSPFSATKTITGGGSAVTNSVTATPSGGTPPYTAVLWTTESGDTINIDSDAAYTTTFSATLGFGEYLSGIKRVTVTDSASATATATVGVSLIDISF